MLLLALACTAPDDPASSDRQESAVPESDSDSPTESPVDSDDPPEGLESGDPISTIRNYNEGFAEWMDAEILPDGRAILVGVTGYAMYDTATGDILRWPEGHGDGRAYRVTVDGDNAWIGSRGDSIRKLDMSGDEPEWATVADDRPFNGYHEDISADGGVVLVAGISEGLAVLDDDGNVQARVDGTNVIACVISGDRCLYTDDDQLILLDLSDPTSPAELDRIEMRGVGRDIDLEDGHVAVAMGGSGVDVFALADDTLTARGGLDLPGSSFGIDVDGDWAWIATWEVLGLAWLGEGGPIVVGHQDPSQSAMGVAARDGIALIADWMFITQVKRNGNFMAPEVHPPGTVWYQDGSTDPVPTFWTNWGAETLELEFTAGGVELSETSLSIEPGEGALLTVTPQEGTGLVEWTSNDPDESSGDMIVDKARGGIGEVHPEMELQGFLPQDGVLETYTLSDYLGKPVFLAYWTTW